MSASSAVDICNGALSRLGVERITTLADSNDRARLCTIQYDKLRDKLLRMHPWNFALSRVSITVDPTAPTWGYNYRYPLPTDTLRVFRVGYPDDEIDFETEGGYILTDESECLAHLIMRITDVSLFDPCFSVALEIMMAEAMCFALTGNNSLKDQLQKDLKAAIQDARSMDAFERSVEQIQTNTWLNARF